MFNTSSKTISAVTAVTVVLAISFATTTFWILLSEQAATAGLLTLDQAKIAQFNLTETPPPGLLQRDPQDIQREASGILNIAAKKTSDVTGDTQSAVSSAVTSLPQIEDYVPFNCSFGMIVFCVGFKHSRSCSSSQLTISAFVLDKIQDLPNPLRDSIQARVKDLSSLPGSLDSLPTAVLGCLIAGSLSFITLLLLSYCVAYGHPTRFATVIQKIGARTQTMVHFGVGLICCVPYVVLVAMQHSVTRAVEKLPAWVEIEAGKIFGISIGAMVFAIMFAAFLAILSCCIRAQSIREVSRIGPSTHSPADVTRSPTSTRCNV
ncbi:hypothetical protein COCHEDRAFT_1161051 [Bipolaris maydis C5]|uniref:Uncharacterized protein n=1 Tax=Cochliobolus heterostrophus (strain C5 / ATCC 48332 / race O) TaxID=701091 RepID=M2TGJ8_COCH5|nr:hypothetical protein COCHEDRAFT_1161051 [Bipolaris maydis C5]KAJ5028955.1 hypothetical protein J3E73DRAFT_184271 [Bipolaris maydis]KAJ6208619.1 hypothetical protein PSV09DRAFT_1161051 [Bipolaris maydis]KAJ6273124.1 hypothetical protein PSV08DRAFT_175259 [Bipolaris maydis]KAJ6284220.1 hypothetical protein J3E71DRAFT_360392 [Bipolaris maydis]